MNVGPLQSYRVAVIVENSTSFTGQRCESFTAWSWSVADGVLTFSVPGKTKRVFNFAKVLWFDVQEMTPE